MARVLPASISGESALLLYYEAMMICMLATWSSLAETLARQPRSMIWQHQSSYDIPLAVYAFVCVRIFFIYWLLRIHAMGGEWSSCLQSLGQVESTQTSSQSTLCRPKLYQAINRNCYTPLKTNSDAHKVFTSDLTVCARPIPADC